MPARTREIPKWFTAFVSEEVSDSTLFKFNIVINNKKIEVDMRADLGVDYTAIQQQLEDTPSEFAYWAALYSELKAGVSTLERRVKARRGVAANHLLEEAFKVGSKVTDKQMAVAIDADEELNRLEGLLANMQKHAGKMYFMIEAIRMKSDNLRSLAGFARIEYQGQKN